VKKQILFSLLCLPFLINAERIPLYFCTAANGDYYSALLNLIGSIHKVNFENTVEIAVFDIGLTQVQIKQLRHIQKVKIYRVEKTHPSIIAPLNTHPGKKSPGSYAWKPVIIKQALDMFPYVLYLDAGTTLLKPVDPIFEHMREHGYFLMDCGPWSIAWQSTRRVVNFFNLESEQNRWILDPETHAIDGGFQGVTREYYDRYIMPMYNVTKNHFELFIDDGTAPNGFGNSRHDQTLFSIYARLLGLNILLHDTQGTGQQTNLSINGTKIPVHITWKPDWVTEQTMVFRSRRLTPDLKYYLSFLKIQ
jgi:uncharacterized lipoprotein YehR (DUF1307 family)